MPRYEIVATAIRRMHVHLFYEVDAPDIETAVSLYKEGKLDCCDEKDMGYSDLDGEILFTVVDLDALNASQARRLGA